MGAHTTEARPDLLLISYDEVGLKGRNRNEFIQRLQKNVREKLDDEGIRWPTGKLYNRLYVEVPARAGRQQIERSVALLQQVAGVARIAPALWLPMEQITGESGKPELERIAPHVAELAEQHHRPSARFAMRATRSDKRFPYSSNQLEKGLGQAIIDRTSWQQVDLSDPDRSFHVEVHSKGVYVYSERHKGLGGLPVGSTGHVVTLFSGGIDSPVAACLIAKRGCTQDLIHFTASHPEQEDLQDHKICRLAEQVSRYAHTIRLHLVPYIYFDMAIMESKTPYQLVLFRRFMARTAQRLGERIGAQALVSGDSLGQVASQTLENMVSNSRSVDMPVLRPLLTYDKDEVIQLARRFDTYHIAIEPYKDCCAIIDRSPRTRSRHGHLSDLEQKLLPDYEKMIETTLADARTVAFRNGYRTGELQATVPPSTGS